MSYRMYKHTVQYVYSLIGERECGNSVSRKEIDGWRRKFTVQVHDTQNTISNHNQESQNDRSDTNALYGIFHNGYSQKKSILSLNA